MSSPFGGGGGGGGGGLRKAAPIVFIASAAVALTIAAGDTELSPAHRRHADLAQYTQFSFDEGHTTGANAGTKMYVEYSLDGGTTWVQLDGTADGQAPTAYVDLSTASILNPAGSTMTWYTIAVAARTEVMLRLVFRDGGGASYNLRNCCVWVR